jgi:hypothetical protein
VKPDQQPAFWNEYTPPASAVAELVQRPAHTVDGYALAAAYIRDARWANKEDTKT